MAGQVTHSAREAAVLHGNGDLDQCTNTLRQVQRQLLAVDRWQVESDAVWSVCGVVKGEVEKWGSGPPTNSMGVVAAALCCLRNSFANCSKNQLLVADTEELLGPVLAATRWTFMADEEEPPEDGSNPEDDCSQKCSRYDEEDEEWRESYGVLSSACVMCLGNMVAANPRTRKLLWPHIKPIVRSLLNHRDWKVSQMACMILHNCLLEEEIRHSFTRSAESQRTMGLLLTLYTQESQFSCFVLFCLELLACSEGVVAGAWPSLSCKQRLLSLDVLSAIVSGSTKTKPESLPADAVAFHVDLYKSEADKILCTHSGTLGQEDSQVVARLASFVCSVAACDARRAVLQRDASLLITTVYLLRCMSDIGKVGDNAFTPMSRVTDLEDEGGMAEAASHPAFGFKVDLIRLIASLVYRHTPNQDQVREIDGILLLLESTCFDARNPLIKEASIFALRNLLEGNEENQRVVRELRCRGVADNLGLHELGMEAVLEDGKLRVQQAEDERDA